MNELAIKMMRLISIVAVLDEECIPDRFDFEWKFIEQFGEYFKKNYPDIYKLLDEEEIDEGIAYIFACPSNRSEIDEYLFSDTYDLEVDEETGFVELDSDSGYILGTQIFYEFCKWALSEKECLNSIVKEIDEEIFGTFLEDYLKGNISGPDRTVEFETDIESFEELESWKKDLEIFAVELEREEQKEKITADNIVRGYSVIYDDNEGDSRIMCAYPDTKFLYFDKLIPNLIAKNLVVDFHEDINEIMNLIINKSYCGYMCTQDIKDLFNSGKLYTIHLEINLTKKEIYLL